MARKTKADGVRSQGGRANDSGPSARPLIAITPGDPEGIGPEIVAKTVREHPSASFVPLLVGAEAPFTHLGVSYQRVESAEQAAVAARSLPAGKALFLAAPSKAPRGRFLPGFQAGWAVETATRAVLAGQARAIVTGPIHKERLQRGGYKYAGHTEFLAKLCKAGDVTMMLANSRLRVSLVTTHCALKDVSRLVTPARVKRAVVQTAHALQTLWRIPQPRIAVAALNPHGGESGLFGKEEMNVLEPTIAALQRQFANRGVRIDGPLPADTLFAKQAEQARFDAVVCMYHDQGLIPVKQLDFAHTVNVTLGLPVIRTSVDHGVAFDIAGRGVADPSSFQSALALAIQFSN